MEHSVCGPLLPEVTHNLQILDAEIHIYPTITGLILLRPDN